MLATALALLTLCASPAPARPGPDPDPDQDQDDKGKKTAHELGVRGRLDLRSTLDQNNAGLRLRGRLARARFEVRYQHESWLRAVVELELGPVPPARIPCPGNPTQSCAAAWAPTPKDIYLRVGKPRMGLRAGHLKPPTSAVELESSWVMPLVRRGWLNDVLESASVAGRRLGVQGELRLREPLQLGFRAGVFHLLPNPEVGTTVSVTSAVGRAELELGPLELGAFAQAGVSSGGSVGINGGADVVADWKLDGAWAVRAWADVVAGNYPQVPARTYVAGRAIAAVRLGGREERAPYGELFATAEGITDDRSPFGSTGPLSGGGGGVAAGLWELVKVTVQAESRSDGEWAVHGQVGASLDAALGL